MNLSKLVFPQEYSHVDNQDPKGITLREYAIIHFMANAPEVPYWFKSNRGEDPPEKPDMPNSVRTHIKTALSKWFDPHYFANVSRDFVEGDTYHEHTLSTNEARKITNFKIDLMVYHEDLHEYELRRKAEHYFAWRRYYAECIVAELE